MTSLTGVSSSRAMAAYVLGTLFFLYAFVQRVSPSVMTSELMRDFSADGTAIGALSSMYFYTYAAIQIPVGVLVDRFGPRKLLAVSALVSAIASVSFGLSESVFAASISRAFIGASVAFAFVATLSIAATFFKPARFAMLAGILLAVGMAGAILGQAPLRVLVEMSGWRGSFFILAGWACVMAVLAFLIVPKRPANLKPDAGHKKSWVTWSVFSNAQTWLCGVIGFGMSTVMLTFGGLWSVPWLETVYQMDSGDASFITSTLFMGWLVGAPIAGWLSDKLRRRKPVVLVGATMCFLTFYILTSVSEHNRTVLVLLYFINGLGASSMVVCFGLVREWNSPKGNATAIGFANMCVVSSGAVLQPLVGWILDRQWTGELIDGVRQYPAAAFDSSFSVLLGVVLLATLCIVFVRESFCVQQVQDTPGVVT